MTDERFLLRILYSVSKRSFGMSSHNDFANRCSGNKRKSKICTVLDSGLLGNFRWTDELFTKALRSFETCLSVNNNLGWKFDSSLESTTIFDEKSKVNSVPYFIFKISTWFWFIKLWNRQFYIKTVIFSFYFYWYYIKAK